MSSPAPEFESISSSVLSLLYGLTLMFVHDYWKNHRIRFFHTKLGQLHPQEDMPLPPCPLRECEPKEQSARPACEHPLLQLSHPFPRLQKMQRLYQSVSYGGEVLCASETVDMECLAFRGILVKSRIYPCYSIKLNDTDRLLWESPRKSKRPTWESSALAEFSPQQFYVPGEQHLSFQVKMKIRTLCPSRRSFKRKG